MFKRTLSYIVSLLVVIILTSMFQPRASLNTFARPASQANCQTFRETGKTVCGRFLEYWQKNGGLAQQGLPLSNEFVEKSDLDGKDYTVQYFERAVFEKHPENQAPYDVLLSQLGTFQGKSKYPNGFPGNTPPPTPGLPPGVLRVGEKAQLKAGVTVTFHAGELNSLSNRIEWSGVVWNETDSVFNFQLDGAAINVKDNTGKGYGYWGSYSTIPREIPARQARPIRVSTLGSPQTSVSYVDLTVSNISGAGPFVWRNLVPWTPAKTYQLSEAAQIGPGVTIEFRTVEIDTNGRIEWSGVIKNNSGSAFSPHIAGEGFSIRDNMGASYDYWGSYSSYPFGEVAAGASANVKIATLGAPKTPIKYIDINVFHVGFGAGPFTWRKTLP